MINESELICFCVDWTQGVLLMIPRASNEECPINRDNINRQSVKNQKLCKYDLRAQR